MTDYFVTRHASALEWARAQGIDAEAVAHLDPDILCAGDRVLGTLPAHLAADVCARGARYFHLILEVPAEARGRDLTAAEMISFGARLIEIEAKRVEKSV